MYIAIDILIILFIFLMIIYLTFDRSRFHIDQQFRYLKKELTEAAAQAEKPVDLQDKRKIREKLELLSGICKDPVFEVFHPYFEVHNELAYEYNEKLEKSIFRGIAKIMGFKEYPVLRFSDKIVLTSKSSGRTIHL